MNSLLSYVFEMWVSAHNMGIDASKSVEIVSSLDVASWLSGPRYLHSLLMARDFENNPAKKFTRMGEGCLIMGSVL